MSWIGLVGKWRYIAIAAACVVVWWKVYSLQNELEMEQSEHRNTQARLAAEVQKGLGWQAAHDRMSLAAEANRVATKACLNRQVEAQKSAQIRETILHMDTPRDRPETEKEQVVSNATRKLAAQRLNRPW